MCPRVAGIKSKRAHRAIGHRESFRHFAKKVAKRRACALKSFGLRQLRLSLALMWSEMCGARRSQRHARWTGFTTRHTEKIIDRERHLRGVFLPSPCDTAFSEGPGSYTQAQVLPVYSEL
jgi:hypothetical protein